MNNANCLRLSKWTKMYGQLGPGQPTSPHVAYMQVRKEKLKKTPSSGFKLFTGSLISGRFLKHDWESYRC